MMSTVSHHELQLGVPAYGVRVAPWIALLLFAQVGPVRPVRAESPVRCWVSSRDMSRRLSAQP